MNEPCKQGPNHICAVIHLSFCAEGRVNLHSRQAARQNGGDADHDPKQPQAFRSSCVGALPMLGSSKLVLLEADGAAAADLLEPHHHVAYNILGM